MNTTKKFLTGLALCAALALTTVKVNAADDGYAVPVLVSTGTVTVASAAITTGNATNLLVATGVRSGARGFQLRNADVAVLINASTSAATNAVFNMEFALSMDGTNWTARQTGAALIAGGTGMAGVGGYSGVIGTYALTNLGIGYLSVQVPLGPAPALFGIRFTKEQLSGWRFIRPAAILHTNNATLLVSNIWMGYFSPTPQR